MLTSNRIPFGYIFYTVRREFAFALIGGFAIYSVSSLLRTYIPQVPLGVPTFLGTAISVILSFKMGQSYDRWWEARRLWGNIVNTSRSFVLQMQSFLPHNEQAVIEVLAYRQIAWSYALGRSLNKELRPLRDTSEFLSREDFIFLEKHINKPLGILQLITWDIRKLYDEDKIPLFAYTQFNDTLIKLTDHMGGCERINNTVFPATYRKFLHLIIYIFATLLFVTFDDMPFYFELPLIVAITIPFFLLEKTAYYLQDPFKHKPTNIPVLTISRNIEINIKQLIGKENIPPPYPEQGFFAV